MPEGQKTQLSPEEAAKKKVEAAQTRRDNFVRLAEARMTKALDAVAVIGNLASPSYDYTPEQIKAMYDSLAKQVNNTFQRFQPKTNSATKTGFSLAQAVAATVETDENTVKEAAE